jgi:hypothetical protein
MLKSFHQPASDFVLNASPLPRNPRFINSAGLERGDFLLYNFCGAEKILSYVVIVYETELLLVIMLAPLLFSTPTTRYLPGPTEIFSPTGSTVSPKTRETTSEPINTTFLLPVTS